MEELLMPPKDAILHWFGELSSQHIKMNADMIPIDWMTKHGTHWLVMVRGRRVLMNSMNDMGVLMMECLLIQQLPQAKCILNDSKPKWAIIDSNHCVMTAWKLFPDKNFIWCCDVVEV